MDADDRAASSAPQEHPLAPERVTSTAPMVAQYASRPTDGALPPLLSLLSTLRATSSDVCAPTILRSLPPSAATSSAPAVSRSLSASSPLPAPMLMPMSPPMSPVPTMLAKVKKPSAQRKQMYRAHMSMTKVQNATNKALEASSSAETSEAEQAVSDQAGVEAKAPYVWARSGQCRPTPRIEATPGAVLFPSATGIEPYEPCELEYCATAEMAEQDDTKHQERLKEFVSWTMVHDNPRLRCDIMKRFVSSVIKSHVVRESDALLVDIISSAAAKYEASVVQSLLCDFLRSVTKYRVVNCEVSRPIESNSGVALPHGIAKGRIVIEKANAGRGVEPEIKSTTVARTRGSIHVSSLPGRMPDGPTTSVRDRNSMCHFVCSMVQQENEYHRDEMVDTFVLSMEAIPDKCEKRRVLKDFASVMVTMYDMYRVVRGLDRGNIFSIPASTQAMTGTKTSVNESDVNKTAAAAPQREGLGARKFNIGCGPKNVPDKLENVTNPPKRRRLAQDEHIHM